MEQKNFWIYPLLFGIIGAFMGLLLRYAYTGAISGITFKNILHSHSHLLLLGFIFNALLLFIWSQFTSGMDKVSYKYFIGLQVCMVIMIIFFIAQGYAFYSILFSTLHLWLSYVLLIRLWKRLKGENNLVLLVKIGIIFHFVSSLGPYALGPLMVLQMKTSPWYQQAIFFYLHFQFFGIYFVWMLALLFKRVQVKLSKAFVLTLATTLVLVYAHSLDYSFDHWSIQVFGGFGAILLAVLLFSKLSVFLHFERPIVFLYTIILFVSICNIAGSFSMFADLLVDNRFILIAWLHFIFLGMYVPFIWVFLNQKVNSITWFFHIIVVFLSEIFLIFSVALSEFLTTSIMWLLFLAYFGVFSCIAWIHLPLIYRINNKTFSIN